MKQEIIIRQHYLDRIKPYIGKQIIKVLTGQRRVGKSFILKSVEAIVREDDPLANVVSIDFEDFAFAHITDAPALHSEVTQRLVTDRMNYVFIDEIQEIEGFEKVVRSLNRLPYVDLYITGSNSSMLSSEIASRLAGRSIEIRIHPLSYPEFLKFHSFTDSDESIERYLHYGGMPYLRNLPNPDSWQEYLTGLANTIVFRDIVGRYPVRNTNFLERLLSYMADNIGQMFTAKRISDYLKSQRQGGTVNSVQVYTDYICQTFMVNKVLRWDIVGKRLFEIGEKYFFEDLGLRNCIVGYKPMDKGKLLENAVYNHLRNTGHDVKVGVLKKPSGSGNTVSDREIDFIAEKNGERKYVQVALSIADTDTASRKFGNLEEIPDNFEKVLITMYDSAPNTHNGIRQLSLRQFLTGGYFFR